MALVARDGLSLIRLSRESGGRFMEVNLPSEIDQSVALRWFLGDQPPAERIAFHASVRKLWHTTWEIGPRQASWAQPVAATSPRLFVLDARVTSEAELRDAARRYHVRAVGWLWMMDRAAPPAPLDGFSFAEHEPGLFESFWRGATEPIRRVVPDPWITWEWRTLLGQPATAPATAPITLDQIRIAHNLMVSRKDDATAAVYRRALVSRLNLPVTAKWSAAVELLGVDHHRGAARSFTPYVLAGSALKCGKVAIKSHVTKRRFLSTLPIDPDVHDLAPLPPIRCELWQPGHIYSAPTVYRHRAGHELFTSAGPARPRPRRNSPWRRSGFERRRAARRIGSS